MDEEIDSRSAVSTVERLSKASALLLASIYGLGFLVVSLDEARYGILQLNLLKSRILAAGALFALLLAVPILAVRRVDRRSPIPKDSEHGWLKWSFDMNRYFNMCIILAAASTALMMGAEWPAHPSNLSTLQIATLVAVMAVSGWITIAFRRNYKTHPGRSALLAWFDFALANVVVLYVLRGFNDYRMLVYWFFLVGLYAAWLDDRFRDARKRQRLYVELLLLLAVTLASAYAIWVYPRLTPSLGGGRPVPVTVYLTQKVAPLPGLEEHLFLVDENDSGFYFMSNLSERQAVFVPRNDVASLVYGERSAPASDR
jgi:hypothetical protein